jgi:2-hydroxy-3-keto-5-methylthiopentenyl-1-phosphate phosphatase
MPPCPPTPSPQPSDPRLLALIDYDGTVTTRDCNEIVLQRFTGDAWRVFEEAAHRGEIGHAECLDRQIGLLQVPRRTFLAAVVEAAEVAPGFSGLLADITGRGGRCVVVSAGFREAIEAVWRRERLPAVDVLASELVGSGRDGDPPFRIAYSSALGDCPVCGPSRCKGAVVDALGEVGQTVAVFGDGLSDLCMARRADIVFAKGMLARLCVTEGIPHQVLDDFGRARAELSSWLACRHKDRQ